MLLLVISVKVTVGLSWGGAAADPVFVMTPYCANGTWQFDDPAQAITHAPLVAGVPARLNPLTDPLPNAAPGFRWFFSAQPVAGYTQTLTPRRTESQGTGYDSSHFIPKGGCARCY